MAFGYGPWGRRPASSTPRQKADASRVRAVEGETFACGACGAILTFSPGASELVCRYCGHRNTLGATAGELVEHDFDAAALAQEPHDLAPTALDASCSSCGADFTLAAGMHAGACPYCEQPVVMPPDNARAPAPHGVLPFLLAREEAQASLQRWMRGLWFAPNALTTSSRQRTRFRGVYLPFWTFDAHTVSDYRGARGDVYYDRQRRMRRIGGKSRMQSVQVAKVRWRSAAGRTARHFDDVLVEAGELLPARIIERLRDWDLLGARPYTPEVIGGFESEVYAVPLDTAFGRAKETMREVVGGDVRAAIGGDRQRIDHLDITYSEPTYKLLLLPVWTAAFTFLDRDYVVAVNGRTGRVVGDRPWSIWKLAGAAVLALLVIALVLLLQSLG